MLVNPAAGGGRAARLAGPVARRLQARGAEVVLLRGRGPQGALTLATEAVGRGVDVLVAVGGDGLVHLALQAVAGTGVALAVVPAGSGNDTARTLGVPGASSGGRDVAALAAAVDAAVLGPARAVDLAVTGTGRFFGSVLACGFDSLVNERADAWAADGRVLRRVPLGRLRYDAAVAVELPRLRPRRYRLVADGTEHVLDAVLVAVGNGASYGGGMRVCPGADVTDGLLDVTVVRPLPAARFVRVFPSVFRGTHVLLPEVSVLRAREVSLAADGMVAYADGERLGPLPVSVRAVPGALRLRVPGTTVGGT